jgi:transcriptional regulator with XRE-family HTH domain
LYRNIMDAKELKDRRLKFQLSQEELGSMLNVAGNTVARWERGEMKIPPYLHLALETLERNLSKGESIKNDNFTSLKKAFFKIETINNQTFEGYTAGEEWNGWAYPYFTFEQAGEILKAFKSLKTFSGKSLNAYYDEKTDSFYFETDSEDEIEEFSVVEIENQKLYPIGAGSWIWETY